MINLSNRLMTIADYIESKDKVIDIGCDHALLDIYLVNNKGIKKIIASDIIEEAINNAKETVYKYNVQKNIDLRLGDGLNVLNIKDKINTIVIAGLGYNKIIKILKENISILKEINKIIVQSSTFPHRVRKYLTSIGYYINDEKVVKENNVFYTIIVFNKGKRSYSKFQIRYGPILLERKDKIYSDHIDFEININVILLKMVPKRYIFRRIKIMLALKMLYKVKKHLIN